MDQVRELLQKVRRIEIRSRGVSDRIFSGEYHSAFKGRGMAFSEVREYIPGDEVRTIDWNVTARYGTPFVKVFEEERELTSMLLVDLSASESFGTRIKTKRELIAELCAVLAFSAIKNNDKVGVLLFTDRVERFIPPKKGRSHILRIIRDLIEFEPQGQGTDIGEALRYLNRIVKKRSICFLISDLQAQGTEKPLRIASQRHDMVALYTRDPREEELPAMGWVTFEDPESGQEKTLNSSLRSVRERYHSAALQREARIQEMLQRTGVDRAELWTNSSYIRPLMELFKRREKLG
ncbi:MAG: DUF58 domain-containing protein [Flavobacteriales bacterium]